MTSKLSLSLILIVIAIFAVGSMVGCSRTQDTPVPEIPSAAVVTPSEPVPPTPTAEPATIWLVADPQVNPATRQEFSAWLAARSEQDGYQFAEVAEFRSSDIPAQLKAAVFLFPGEEASSFAANLPDTQFVAVTAGEYPTAANLSVIQTSTNQASFLAGYLAILDAPDFRAGGLFVDDPAGREKENSFLNGGRYLCGRCSPVFTPLVPFPQTGLVPANSGVEAWQSALDALNQNRIEMLYISAEGLTPEFLSYLSDKNIGILSDTPPPSGFESNWVATVSTNPLAALETLWPAIMAGSGGQNASAGLEISNVNPDNLSIGRLELAKKLIPDLENGRIIPLSVP